MSSSVILVTYRKLNVVIVKIIKTIKRYEHSESPRKINTLITIYYVSIFAILFVCFAKTHEQFITQYYSLEYLKNHTTPLIYNSIKIAFKISMLLSPAIVLTDGATLVAYNMYLLFELYLFEKFNRKQYKLCDLHLINNKEYQTFTRMHLRSVAIHHMRLIRYVTNKIINIQTYIMAFKIETLPYFSFAIRF